MSLKPMEATPKHVTSIATHANSRDSSISLHHGSPLLNSRYQSAPSLKEVRLPSRNAMPTRFKK